MKPQSVRLVRLTSRHLLAPVPGAPVRAFSRMLVRIVGCLSPTSGNNVTASQAVPGCRRSPAGAEPPRRRWCLLLAAELPTCAECAAWLLAVFLVFP